MPAARLEPLSRRRFLVASGALATASYWKPEPLLASRFQAQQQFGDLRVTKIETHDIGLEYHDWLHHVLNHYYGPVGRTVYVVHTQRGLVGLGERGSLEAESVRNKYIGSNPFDWVGDETSLGLGTAMYDLMGQAAAVPVYKLFGQRYRSWVPVASWTVSTQPDRLVGACGHGSITPERTSAGYTRFRFGLFRYRSG